MAAAGVTVADSIEDAFMLGFDLGAAGGVPADRVRECAKCLQPFYVKDVTVGLETEEDSLFVLNDGLCVLNCAGMGDVGYFNRWTMEITNNSQYHTIPLVVGRRIAQILFFDVGDVSAPDLYEKRGKYQATTNVEELRGQWGPEAMLPKQWLDRESRAVG